MKHQTDEVLYDDERHEYRWADSGALIPSVTGIIREVVWGGRSSAPSPDALAAMRLGTDVHKAIELYERRGVPEEMPDIVADYFEGWVQFVKAYGATVQETEVMVSSRKFNYAGRLDHIVSFRSKGRPVTAVVDVKTGANVYRETGVQLAAYAAAYYPTQWRNFRRFAVHLKPYDFSIVEFADPNDLDVFRAMQVIYNFKQRR